MWYREEVKGQRLEHRRKDSEESFGISSVMSSNIEEEEPGENIDGS